MLCNRSMFRRAVHVTSLATLAVLLSLKSSASLHAQDAEEQHREQVKRGMRLRAEATTVVQLDDGKQIDSKVSADALFRYGDEPRDIVDATLWGYGGPGRPVAFQKIEFYRDRGTARWFYCMTSLSESLIESKWRDGQSWSSKQPGITMQTLPLGPKPAEKERARLTQMKQIARRFEALLFDEPTDNPVKKPVPMRPLARPIYRYADLAHGIKDGVIFGFAASGTNPDALLAIELHQAGSSQVWKFDLARMTIFQVIVKLDEKQVWRVPFVPWEGTDRPSKFDTWLFFHESVVNDAIRGR